MYGVTCLYCIDYSSAVDGSTGGFIKSQPGNGFRIPSPAGSEALANSRKDGMLRCMVYIYSDVCICSDIGVHMDMYIGVIEGILHKLDRLCFENTELVEQSRYVYTLLCMLS